MASVRDISNYFFSESGAAMGTLGAEDVLQNASFDSLDPVVERLLCDCVRIDGQRKAHFVQRFQKVLQRVIESMCECDASFKRVFNRVGYTGSFFDGVRVAEATEFDLNLVLKPKSFCMEIAKGRPGFIDILVVSSGAGAEEGLRDWVVGGRLSPQRVRQWLQGVLQRAVKRMQADDAATDGCQVRLSTSGPAATLWVRGKGERGELSIDLVPVFEFAASQWPPVPRKPKRLLHTGYEKSWFAVPKGSESWRMSFPNQERDMIKDLQYFKYTIRLIKKVRDELGVGRLASYYIKTLFLYELERDQDRETSRRFWATNRRGRLFLYMLCRLRDALNAGEIRFFWDQRLNLLEAVRADSLRNDRGRVNNFVAQLAKLARAGDPAALSDYVLKQLNQGGDRTRAPPHTPPLPPPPPPRQAASSCSVQ